MEGLLLVGWLLTVKACAGAVCKTVLELPIASESACYIRADRFAFRSPDTPPALWGFPAAKAVDVRTFCEPLKGTAVGA